MCGRGVFSGKVAMQRTKQLQESELSGGIFNLKRNETIVWANPFGEGVKEYKYFW